MFEAFFSPSDMAASGVPGAVDLSVANVLDIAARGVPGAVDLSAASVLATGVVTLEKYVVIEDPLPGLD